MKQEYRTLKLVMEKEKYDIIQKGIWSVKKVTDTWNMLDARALELQAVEFMITHLGGVPETTEK